MFYFRLSSIKLFSVGCLIVTCLGSLSSVRASTIDSTTTSSSETITTQNQNSAPKNKVPTQKTDMMVAPSESVSESVPKGVTAEVARIASLKDIFRLLTTSSAWKTNDLNYQAANLALKATRSKAGPTVEVSGDIQHVKHPWEDGEWKNSSSLSVAAGASVLPWSPALAAVQQAERKVQTAKIDLRHSRARLALEAAQAYVAAYQVISEVELTRERLVLAQKAQEVAESQHQQGLLTRAALLERQGAVISAQAGLARAERQKSLVAQQLVRLLERRIELPQKSSQLEPLTWPLDARNEEKLVQLALEARPEIAKAQAAILDAETALGVARRAHMLPDLNAGVRVGQLNDGAGGSGNVISANLNLKTGVLSGKATMALKDTSKLKNGFAVNVGGTFTLLGAGKQEDVQKTVLQVKQAKLALSTARQAVVLEVRTRLSEYQNALDNLKPLQTSLKRAEVALTDTRGRLKAGLGTPLELLQAEVNMKQAHNALMNQQMALGLAALQLAQVTGHFDPWIKLNKKAQ